MEHSQTFGDRLDPNFRKLLIMVRDDLDSGVIPPEKFHMATWYGTACCAGAWMQIYSHDMGIQCDELHQICFDGTLGHPLFYPGRTGGYAAKPADAVKAINNFLFDGNPRWGEIMMDNCHNPDT